MARILVIDDEYAVAATLSLQLKALGHEPVVIHDAKSILHGDEKIEIDLIITDIFMPGVDGLDFILNIKKSRFADLPIIAISGGGYTLDNIDDLERSYVARAATAFGAVQFIAKPISLKNLKKAIEISLALQSL